MFLTSTSEAEISLVIKNWKKNIALIVTNSKNLYLKQNML